MSSSRTSPWRPSGSSILLFHRAVGPAEMRVDAVTCDQPFFPCFLVGIRNRGRQGEVAGLITDRATGRPALPDAPFFRLQDVTLNAPGDVFSFGARGTIGQAAGKRAMVETTSLGRVSMQRQDQGSIVCITYPDFVATYTVTVTRGESVLFEATVDADACATLPERAQQILGVWTDMRPLSLKGPDLVGIVKLRGNGVPVQIRISPTETAPGEVQLTGWEMTATGNFQVNASGNDE